MNSTAAESPEAKSDKKTSPQELIKYIHEQGMRAGVAIKPGTNVEVLYEILDNSNKDEVPDVSSASRPLLISLILQYSYITDGSHYDCRARFWRAKIHA